MNAHRVPRLEHEVDARADLVGGDKLPHLVEAQAVVEGDIIGEPPFVLKVDTRKKAPLCIWIGDPEWRCAHISGVWIDRQQRIVIVDIGDLRVRGEAGPDSVAIIQLIGRVSLDAICKRAAEHGRGHAIEHQVSQLIRPKQDAGIAVHIRHLHIPIVDFLLPGNHAEDVALVLIFIEV
jgi:hypothetical protein